jgi:hypothetical protein
MLAEPKVVQRADQPYVAIRALVTMETLGAVVPPLNREVFGWLAERGVVASGEPFWKYNVIDMERQLEVEAGAPVAVPVWVMIASSLASFQADSTRPCGTPVIPAAWLTRRRHWGARLEIYETDPAEEPDMDKWVTELAFRLAT